MYSTWFRFEQLPFRLRPDPAFLYLDGHNAQEYQQLLAVMRRPGDVVTLTGEPGVGKSTWLRAALLARHGEALPTAQLVQSDLSTEELHLALSEQFGLDVRGSAVAEHAEAQQRFFVEQRAAGRSALIVCDGAHQFTPDTLMALLQMSTTSCAPGLILAGEPALYAHLRAGFGARDCQALAIYPLDLPGLTAYIRHRLKLVGAGDRETFAEEVFGEMFRYTGGIPRLINILCDKALCLAEGHRSESVTLQDVLASVRELNWSEYQTPAESSDNSAVPGARPTLIFHDGSHLRRIVLKDGCLTIGRASENGLQIDRPSISRIHCQLVMGKNGCFIKDLGSANGVSVNHKRVRVARLMPDDVISLGEMTLTFTLGEAY